MVVGQRKKLFIRPIGSFWPITQNPWYSEAKALYIRSERRTRVTEEEVEIRFPKLSDRAKTWIVGAVYRQALVEVGHSPDYHVYDLEKSFLVHKQDLTAGQFVQRVYDFYYSLGDLERRVFLCECLEHGRHYPFWWLSMCDQKHYSRALHSVCRKTSSSF